MNAFLAAATCYARRGWRVFPLVAKTKRPATPHGVKDASVERASLEAWWQRWPCAGVGAATGGSSDLVVLDIDPRNGGDDSLADLEAQIGELPETPVSLTGGGGAHYLFHHPGGQVPNRTALGGFAGLDLKADGGYIVAPPSVHPNGHEYVWNVMLHPADIPLAPCPPALLALAREKAELHRVGYKRSAWDGSVPPRVRTLLRSDRRVRDRFRRSTERLRDTSPSGVDFALAATLAIRGLSGAEIEAAIKASRVQAQLPERAPSYFDATIGKALGAVQRA